MSMLGPDRQGRGSMLEQVAQTENKRRRKVKAGHFLFQVGKVDGTGLSLCLVFQVKTIKL